MKNPFEKMFSENFKNPKPENDSQFNELENNEELKLVQEAAIKA